MQILEALSRYAGTGRTAILYGDESLSYAALEERSNAFAAWLLSLPVQDSAPVLIYGHKELDIPACMFGALKAGRAYVPIDISFPPERVRQIAEELRPGAVISFRPEELGLPQVLRGQALESILSQKAAAPSPSHWVKGGENAYILFTSGSTGRPKGVQITADNIVSFLQGVAPWLDTEPEGSVFLNAVSYSFDVAVCALHYALGRGLTLFTLDKETMSEPRRLFEALAVSRLRTWVSTPSLAELCLQSERFCTALLPELREILLCGEVLTDKLSRQLLSRFPGLRLVNAYGPTEATVLVTAADITEAMLGQAETMPIGVPFSTVKLWIADGEGRPLPEGEEGELILCGESVSPGYLARPELTARAFFTAPGGERCYHTGDLCHIRDGWVYYCGRLDNQVKLNGFRVELEDVENNLLRLENVSRAAVLPVYTEGKVSSLAAFVLLEKPDGLTTLKRAKLLRSALSELLPNYMVPRRILAVESFPLNTNGKVDKKALAQLL